VNILFAQIAFPEPDRNAGDLRIVAMLAILVSDGHKVTFLAEECRDKRYLDELENAGVNCVWDSDIRLREDAQFFSELAANVAIFARHMSFGRYVQSVRWFLPECAVVLDTVDIHWVRMRREAELTKDADLLQRSARIRSIEDAAANEADAVWFVTDADRDVLKGESHTTAIVPIIHHVEETVPTFDERDGIVFIGNFRHTPNVDAVKFFVDEVLPLVRLELGDLKFTIVGAEPTAEIERLGDTCVNVCVLGFVDDHRAALRSHRVSVAPLRFGAGMKGKIGEYLACGTPCVTTTVGGEGMGLEQNDGVKISDDPEVMAASIIAYYADRELWQRGSAAGVQFIRETLTPEAIRPVLLDAIDAAQTARRRRRVLWRRVCERISRFVTSRAPNLSANIER
jgi:O-antigen biosynthesis protein